MPIEMQLFAAKHTTGCSEVESLLRRDKGCSCRAEINKSSFHFTITPLVLDIHSDNKSIKKDVSSNYKYFNNKKAY